jgi:hypothetical protein
VSPVKTVEDLVDEESEEEPSAKRAKTDKVEEIEEDTQAPSTPIWGDEDTTTTTVKVTTTTTTTTTEEDDFNHEPDEQARRFDEERRAHIVNEVFGEPSEYDGFKAKECEFLQNTVFACHESATTRFEADGARLCIQHYDETMAKHKKQQKVDKLINQFFEDVVESCNHQFIKTSYDDSEKQYTCKHCKASVLRGVLPMKYRVVPEDTGRKASSKELLTNLGITRQNRTQEYKNSSVNRENINYL